MMLLFICEVDYFRTRWLFVLRKFVVLKMLFWIEIPLRSVTRNLSWLFWRAVSLLVIWIIYYVRDRCLCKAFHCHFGSWVRFNMLQLFLFLYRYWALSSKGNGRLSRKTNSYKKLEFLQFNTSWSLMWLSFQCTYHNLFKLIWNYSWLWESEYTCFDFFISLFNIFRLKWWSTKG